MDEDQIMNYILLRCAKSLYIIKNSGYYYLPNSMSITRRNTFNNPIRNIYRFIYLKIIFEYSRNTKYEKDMSNFLATSSFKALQLKPNYFNFTFFYELTNIYQSSKFISDDNKNHLLNIKNKLIRK